MGDPTEDGRLAAMLGADAVIDLENPAAPVVENTQSRDQWFERLIWKHDDQIRQQHLRTRMQYYQGTQPLRFMLDLINIELGIDIEPLRFAWPRLVIDSIDSKIDVAGFRRPNEDSGDEELWEIWQYNNMENASQATHVEAMIYSHCFVSIGSNPKEQKFPIIRQESPLNMVADYDPQTLEVRAALKRWRDRTLDIEYATLYLQDETVVYKRVGGTWEIVSVDKHNMGVVPVVPAVNRWSPRLPEGVSELEDIMPIADAANKLATDMMTAAEHHAIPRRMVFGVDEKDFEDEDGNKLTAWEKAIGAVWAITDKDAKAMQFNASDLKNFETAINLLAKQVSAIYGLPAVSLGFTTDNPASAESLDSQGVKHDKNVERKITQFGSGTWKKVMQIAERIRDGNFNPESVKLKVEFADPSTPTASKRADAVVKLVQTGIIPVGQARIDLGYSPTVIAAMEAFERQEDQDSVMAMSARYQQQIGASDDGTANSSGGNSAPKQLPGAANS